MKSRYIKKFVRQNLSARTLKHLVGIRNQLLSWCTAFGKFFLELGLKLTEYGIESPFVEAEDLGYRLIGKGGEFVGAGARYDHFDQPVLTSFPGRDQEVLDCCIAYNRYGAYCIPMSSHHRAAAQEVLGGGVYEKRTIKYIRQNYEKKDIIHAGTYFGDFIPALSHICDRGSKVWAFEPNPENYRCARTTILLNGIKNVELRNEGLGGENGVMPLTIETASGKPAGGSSTFVASKDYPSGKKTVDVKVVKIDSVIPKSRDISLIHLDVEGFEVQALKGAIKTINRCRPIIIMEYYSGQKWIKDNILNRGYKYIGDIHLNSVFEPF